MGLQDIRIGPVLGQTVTYESKGSIEIDRSPMATQDEDQSAYDHLVTRFKLLIVTIYYLRV